MPTATAIRENWDSQLQDVAKMGVREASPVEAERDRPVDTLAYQSSNGIILHEMRNPERLAQLIFERIPYKNGNRTSRGTQVRRAVWWEKFLPHPKARHRSGDERQEIRNVNAWLFWDETRLTSDELLGMYMHEEGLVDWSKAIPSPEVPFVSPKTGKPFQFSEPRA